MWYDPVAKQYWTYANFQTTYAEAQAVCVGDWKVPSPQEWRLAAARGLTKSYGSTAIYVWVNDGTAVNYAGVVGAAGQPFCVQVDRSDNAP